MKNRSHFKSNGTRSRGCVFFSFLENVEDVIMFTFFRGANFGGSRITKSHCSFLEIAPFINAVASPFRNEIRSGFNSLRAIFSLARSSADFDESMPENGYAC